MMAWIEQHYLWILGVILAFALITRVYRLHEPSRYVFDEVYHAVTAKLINRNDLRAYEWWNPPPEPDTAVDWLHPPLAKYTQALGIEIFGENSFGWRISSALFGMLVILTTYLLAEELFGKKALSLAAAALASFDGLLLVQSRTAMNDIHVTFFILLTLILYLRYLKQKTIFFDKSRSAAKPSLARLVWLTFSVALGSGLAMGSKWSGLFVLFIVLSAELVFWVNLLWETFAKQKTLRALGAQVGLGFVTFLILAAVPFVIYVSSYAHMFAQGKSLFCFQAQQIQGECYFEIYKWRGQEVGKGYISHFAELHRQIWWYQTNLKAEHPYQSRPLQWFLNLRPVWYHVEYPSESQSLNIYAQGNPLLFWFGDLAVILSIIWLGSSLFKFPQLSARSQFITSRVLFLVFAFFAVWLPWQLSPRIMFFYHYTPAVPLLSIILSYWLYQLAKARMTIGIGFGYLLHINRVIVAVVLLAIAITFFLWFPNWTGLPISKDFADALYFGLKIWK